MKIRFEENGALVMDEVSFPHAELPLGEEVTLTVHGKRTRYQVLSVSMLVDGGELKALVEIAPSTH